MKYYRVSNQDIKNNYFHFTKKVNLENIKNNGLIPKRGAHAQFLEQTDKVFFVEGLDNLLVLFDCWINVYKRIPLFPDSFKLYGAASYAMRSKWFPMFIVDVFFSLTKHSKIHKRRAYKIFDKLLDECILLNLDIKEDEDFILDDIDEIKSRGFRTRHLITLGYSLKYSDMESNIMDRWNMHTISGHGVLPSKIKICLLDYSTNIKDILIFALNNTSIDLSDICPVLYDYLISRKYI